MQIEWPTVFHAISTESSRNEKILQTVHTQWLSSSEDYATGYWHISSRSQLLHIADSPFSSLIRVDTSPTVYSSLEIEEADNENEVFIVSDGEVPLQSVGILSFLNTLVCSSFEEEADLGEFEMSTAVLDDASWGSSLRLDTPCFRFVPNNLRVQVSNSRDNKGAN